MASIKHNQRSIKLQNKRTKIGIVVSLYNREITDKLEESCIGELKKAGLPLANIMIMYVPGAFEIPYACQALARKKKTNVIITLGCILKGETPHFDFIARAATQGIMQVSLAHHIPIIFGILTPNTLAQAKARVRGGSRGDKGVEAAQTALHLLSIKK